MTAAERSVCDCPEPCGCYAEGHAAGYTEGKDKAYFESWPASRARPTPKIAAASPAR